MSAELSHVRVAPSPRPILWQDYSKTRRFVLNKLAQFLTTLAGTMTGLWLWFG